MFALIAVAFVLPWLIVLGALAAERWLESSVAPNTRSETDGEDRS
jgi:hypothetical protein